MTIKKLLHKGLTAIGIRKEQYYLFQIEITKEKLECNPLAEGFDAVEINAYNINEYDFSLFEKKINQFINRLSNPTFRMYAVVEGKKVCYYTWISFDEFIFPRYVEQKKELNHDEAFLFDSACAEEYKGRGFHSYMNIFRLRKIYESGRKSGLVLVLEGNSPAMKVQVKSGMKIVKVMKTFHCSWLGIDKVTFSDYEG